MNKLKAEKGEPLRRKMTGNTNSKATDWLWFGLYEFSKAGVFTIQVALKRLCCGPLGGRARAVHRHGRHSEGVLCATLQTWTGNTNRSDSKHGF